MLFRPKYYLYLILLIYPLIAHSTGNNDYSISKIDNIKKDVILDNLDEINFGLVLSGDSAVRTIWLTNNSIEDVEIDKLYVLGLSGNAFSVNSSPMIPVILKKGEKLKINIKFSPMIIKEFSDSLIISFIYPFPFKHTIRLSGASQVKHLIWISDTSAVLGGNSVKLTVRIKFLDVFEIYHKYSYTLKVSFDASVFYPTSVTRGTIISNEIINGRRVLVIQDAGITLYNNPNILTEIIGEVLLGESSYTSIEILNFYWNEPWIVPVPSNSMLYVSQPCQSSLNQIQLLENQSIKIYPNPGVESTNIEVVFPENGRYNFQIYSLNGKLKKSDSFNNVNYTKISKFNVPIDLTEFSSGAYYIIINTPTQQFKTYFSVFK